MEEPQKKLLREKEYTGSLWRHPFMAYIWLSALLFIGLVVVACVAWKNGWIPNRGIGAPQ